MQACTCSRICRRAAKRERDLEVLSYLWLAGEVLSLLGITAGAALTLLVRGPNGDSQTARPSARVRRPEVHPPLNHRLLLEAEW